MIIGVLSLVLQKNSNLQKSYKILNTTGWSFLQFTLILCVQDFKSCKQAFIFIVWKGEVNYNKFLLFCCKIRLTFIFMCLNSFTKNTIDYVFWKIIPKIKLFDILLHEQIFKGHVTKLLIHAVWRFQVRKLV